MQFVQPSRLLTPHRPHHSLFPALTSFIDKAPRSFHLGNLRQWYLDQGTDPLHPALLFCAGMSAIVWVLGEVTGNVSQVDRLWTFLPLIYSAHFTFLPWLNGTVSSISELDHRMLLVFALQVAWSARLSYQAARRGFFDPRSEDYRWPLVRSKVPTWAFKLLNLFFISIAQNILLLAAELPQYLLLTHSLSSSGRHAQLAKLKPHHAPTSVVPLNIADIVLAVLFITTLFLEMKADNEQQAYQTLKKNAQRKDEGARTEKERKAIERGFVTGGLWSWSRHPNFACEQATWFLLYAFTVVPFIPLAQSFTSHPLSTLNTILTPSKISSSLLSLSNSLPSFDNLLTYAEHPLTFYRALDRSSFTTRALAKSKLHALQAWNEVKQDEGTWWNYSIASPLLMSALFFASTDLTERITASKYPLYGAYQSRVAKFWPALTPLKGVWLALTGRKSRIDHEVFGTGETIKGGKGKGKEKTL
ncbi:hypothetical protein JCM21900_006335 [Sporobolomyces salmonicolor]